MPGVVLSPAQEQPISRGFARTERIERQTVSPPGRAGLWVPPFTSPVALGAGDESEPWYADHNLRIVLMRVSTLANAAADNTIEFRVDSSPIQQFTLAAGTRTVLTPCAILVGEGSYITVMTITGTDPKLTVQPTAQ